MLFKKKLRKTYDEHLIETLERVKEEWFTKRELVQKSVEPPYELLYELKLAESKYLFLLKEAKIRKISMKP
ncbi:DUF2508 domain-containing protein [Pueribacillus theae]|uniref:DUF2508 domain-containing protein n=1 Tax=Pueribacillus theae TaxID=2171751 RepID=A0A2U1K3J0_9BACI|nr:YaaL family protein [Pueribacillus theae]PWA12097.1 DUF2508 domain-containing protein [Pueribacillus theae]